MKSIFTIFKKELKRFFTDVRMLVVLILPGILIYVIYTIMGGFLGDFFSGSEDYTYKIYAVNEPTEIRQMLTSSGLGLEITDNFNLSEDEVKEMIKDGDIDLFVKYEDDFINRVISYDVTSTLSAPRVSIYYNTSNQNSAIIYEGYTALLSAFENSLANKFDVNADIGEVYDFYTDDDMSVQMITMIMPYLLVLLLFTGSMSVIPESIAGEKERGTIATLLVTPIKRSHFAIGKILGLSVVTLVSALSSFLGVLLSLPNLMEGANLNLNVYGVGVYLAIFAIIIVTELIFNALLCLLSAYAKSVKEASNYSAPVMIVVLILGLTSMLNNGGSLTNPLLYLIPVYNSVQCMSSIFALKFSVLPFVITVIANLVYFGLGVVGLTKMFSNEKIMFNK